MKPQNNFNVDFIGIGDQKAGTTWLFQCLKDHPDICGSTIKETRFFDRDDFYKKGLCFYSTFFECSEKKLKGEYSPSYLHNSKTAKRIHSSFPDVKIIISLRNPIEKSYSLYWFNKLGGSGSTRSYDSFEDAINGSSHIVKDSFYYESLKIYFDNFPSKNIFIVLYDDIINDPKSVMESIYRFLGVENKFISKYLEKKINASGDKVLIIPLINDIIYFFNKIINNNRFLNILFRNINKKKIKQFLIKINSKNKGGFIKPEMKLETKKYLLDLFIEDIEKVELLINKDLNIWKK